MTGRFHTAQIDLSAQFQIFVGRCGRQESGIADVAATARAGFAVNFEFNSSGGQTEFHLMPKSVIDGLIAKQINGASSASVQTDSQMSLDKFNGGKVRFGRRSATVKQDTISALCLELESNGGAGFSDASSAK
jgi:hypothetical protein